MEHKRKPAKRATRRRKRKGRPDIATPEGFTSARLTLDLYQKDLGTALGITKNAVYLKEAGARPIVERDVLALEALLRRAGKWPLS